MKRIDTTCVMGFHHQFLGKRTLAKRHHLGLSRLGDTSTGCSIEWRAGHIVLLSIAVVKVFGIAENAHKRKSKQNAVAS